MKLFHNLVVTYSQRLDYLENRLEWREGVEIELPKWIEGLGGIPIAIPNGLQNLKEWLQKIKPDLCILSGGNTISPSLYSQSENKEPSWVRDLTEIDVLRYAIQNNIPLFGICRGMQMINVYFGGALVNQVGHVSTQHEVFIDDKSYEVNSFHNQSVTGEVLAEGLKIRAYSNDGNIEALEHQTHRIAGVQWHPERVGPEEEVSMRILKNLMLSEEK